MPELLQLLPVEKSVSTEDLAAHIRKAASAPIGVAAPEAITFCTSLSQALTSNARARPFSSLQALGFWLRPSAIISEVQSSLGTPELSLRMPRGTVFQIPPAGIDSLFGYLAALSLLSGNVTLVRLPGERTPVEDVLLTLIRETLACAHEAVQSRLVFVRYPHDDEITAALSALCDARMVWGDDETIAHFRQTPLPALAHEACFGNRFSAAALEAAHYAELGEPQKQHIVHALFNDIYLFDQLSCSSPRLMIWVGDRETADRASDDFYRRLADYAQECLAHMALRDKLAKPGSLEAAPLIPSASSAAHIYNGALTVMNLPGWDDLAAYKSVKGRGLLLSARLDQLRDLAALAERRDQTLAVWGFGPEEVLSFVSLCGGRGFDRIVPIGQALSFDPVWDGASLFDTLTRFVQVTV